MASCQSALAARRPFSPDGESLCSSVRVVHRTAEHSGQIRLPERTVSISSTNSKAFCRFKSHFFASS